MGSIHKFPLGECEHCKEIENVRFEKYRKEQLRKEYRNAIPERYMTASFSDFGKEIDIVKKWCINPKEFLFVYSPCGIGKTHLICSMVYEMRKIGITTSLFFASEMFLRLRNTFGNSSKENESNVVEEFEHFSTVHAFDDVGVQKISDYTTEAWYNIINYRYSNLLPTVFTSNLSLKEISAYMTDRIASRLASGIVFELKGRDRRVNVK
jgi:DNA replication protein DnaC